MMNNEINPTYKVGDRVRVINYGGLVDQIMGTGEIKKVDLAPELVGKEGTVVQIMSQQGRPKYMLTGIPMKTAWYDEEQLELVQMLDTHGDSFVTLDDDFINGTVPGIGLSEFKIELSSGMLAQINAVPKDEPVKVSYKTLSVEELREVTIEVRRVRNADAPRYEAKSKLLQTLMKDVAFMYGDDLLSTLSCIDTLLKNEIVRRFVVKEI